MAIVLNTSFKKDDSSDIIAVLKEDDGTYIIMHYTGVDKEEELCRINSQGIKKIIGEEMMDFVHTIILDFKSEFSEYE
jgi:uncharacterized protein YbcI